ncbi:polysaccharide lyase 8 family protein [Flexithrix dorotheae]|uniref:polysaccharide lyase 8 family protein n=1 Tax=Flexithrix dorotheae TaxID=70993 RepID=UPI0003807BEF|nr:polysaccharide lyase 8 family protein [Flexithrix dorotheae]
MKNKLTADLQILIISLFFILPIHSYAQESDIEILRNRLVEGALNLEFRPRTDRYIASDYSKANVYLAEMNSNGSWNDVDYQDRDNNWSALVHLDKMLVMTINYSRESSSYFQNEELLNGLEKALTYWYQVNPVSDNWYKNKIAKQFYLNIIGLLLQNKIDNQLHEKIVSDLTPVPTMTGSNRTLLATSTLYRGVIERNEDRIKSGIKGVTDQIEISSEEGIQPDFSFHQHGHFIYNGSYGLNLLRESIWLATIVHGTAFAYSEEQIETLRKYFLEGTRWMIRGGLIDYNVRGRQVGRTDGDLLLGEELLPQLERLKIVDPAFSSPYQSSKTHIENKTSQEIEGNKHFWRSDYTAHHKDGYFTALKMCSERTVGIELNMNSENKLGYWLPYGLTYIYRRGNEYQGIFPAWDWAKLPGVTSPHQEFVEQKKGPNYTQKTSFVGGVSDGNYGVSAMDFSKDKTKAKKSWFWFDEEWVALGAGINSSHEAAIVTGINQCHLQGEIEIDGRKFTNTMQSLKNPKLIVHDSIGYIFPTDQTVEIKSDVQQGNLQRIYGLGKDTVYAPRVFSLWFDHGPSPKNAQYAYIVVPGKSSEELAAYAKNTSIEILSNTPELQAVKNAPLDMIGVVFHKAGNIEVGQGISLQVNHPALVLLNLKNGEVSVSDPTTRLGELKITLTKKGAHPQTQNIALPSGEMAGKSVNFSIAFSTK